MFIAVAAVIAVVSGSSPVWAVDADPSDSVGVFSNPARTPEPGGGTLAIECLQYGTGNPPAFSDIDPTDPVMWQSNLAGSRNQVRFGRIPQAFGGGCSADPSASMGLGSSGFGFEGASVPAQMSGFVELGRLYHWNRTIERGLHSVDLEVSLTISDAIIGQSVNFATTYGIDLDETPDFAPPNGDISQCEYDTPKNTTSTTILGIAGLCADRVAVQQLIPFHYAEIGVTSITLDIAGFTEVIDGQCDPSTLTGEPRVFTAEQVENALCLLAKITPGTLTIEKSLSGLDDGEFEFEIEQYDQNPNGAQPVDGTRTVSTVVTEQGSGSSAPLSLEPGTYRLEEVAESLPAGVKVSDLSCVSDRGEGTVTLGGDTYVDIDSNASVRCSFTNTLDTTEPDIEPSPVPEGGSGPDATDTAGPGVTELADTGVAEIGGALYALGMLGIGVFIVALSAVRYPKRPET